VNVAKAFNDALPLTGVILTKLDGDARGGAALSVRHVLSTMGPDTMAVVPPSCMAIIAGPQPFSSLRIPVYQPTLESSAAAASGTTSRRWRPR